MQTRAIGSLQASVVGLGCNNFGGRIDEPATKAVVAAALDAGITLFDTADIYGGTLSEEYLGRALATRRDEALIATKFGVPIDDDRKGGASAAYVQRACDDSLKRLGTDRIDLYQLHFPDPQHPAGRDAGRARRAGARGQGARDRVQQLLGRDARGSGADQRAARHRPLRERAERVQPAPALAREERRARREREARHRVHPVLPAGERDAHRQVPAQRAARRTGRGSRACPPIAATRRSPTRTSTASRSSRQCASAHGHSLLELAFAWLLARPAGRERDRGRDETGAGARERGGRRLGTHRAGCRGDRRGDRASEGLIPLGRITRVRATMFAPTAATSIETAAAATIAAPCPGRKRPGVEPDRRDRRRHAELGGREHSVARAGSRTTRAASTGTTTEATRAARRGGRRPPTERAHAGRAGRRASRRTTGRRSLRRSRSAGRRRAGARPAR